MKLQDAFVAETGAYYGSWNKIGYTAPGQSTAGTASAASGQTANFKYEQVGTYDASQQTADIPASGSGQQVWKASNLIKLNDCPAAENWNIMLEAGSTAAGAIKYTAYYLDANKTNCSPLTAAFENIGK